VLSVLAVYVYHWVWDTLFCAPLCQYLVRAQHLQVKNVDKCRESLWKNVAVATFFCMGLTIGWKEPWFMNRALYFEQWHGSSNFTPELMRWYYTLYGAYFLQGMDFILSITGEYYQVKRKDNREMLVHHASTLCLMLFSYFIDFTRVGVCVLMIHDVNDLLLETAKIFVYLDWKVLADVMFGIFAVVWYIARWWFYATNIVFGVYYDSYEQVLLKIYEEGGYGGYSSNAWFMIYVSFNVLLMTLLALHIYWGYLIGVMVLRALLTGEVEKDIRSESEPEDLDTSCPTEEPVEAFKVTRRMKSRKE